MQTSELLQRLRRVKQNGKGWTACCPAHDDKHPSLSIREEGDKLLLHCHAGCSTEAVSAALGIDLSDLFTNNRNNSHSKIEAVYDYVDESGKLLYQVVRYFGKKFSQRRPDGHGGWIYNLDGVRRVLYRLLELLYASSILICEGEKDCETARRLGFVATCNSGGAGKWRKEYAGLVWGKPVTIIADADEPGRIHAQQVAESLWGQPSPIKVVELPGAKDLTNWAEGGGTRDELVELFLRTPEWKPNEPAHKASSSKRIGAGGGYVLTPLGELLARPDAPVEYVVDETLVAGTVSVVIAKPKVGKSTLERNLALAVARGDDFLGRKTKQGEVIYLALEEREDDVKKDFRAMGADGTEPILIHAAAPPAEGIVKLCDLLKQRHPVLVVGDPLFRLARIREEKAYAEIYAVLGPLIDIAREVGTHISLPHHAGKVLKADPIDSPLGSTALGGVAATLILLKRSESRRTIQTVQRIGRDMAETILEFDPESRTLSLGVEKVHADVRATAEAILEYLKGADDPKTEREINADVEGTTSLKRKALRKLVGEGKVAREDTGLRGHPFKYKCLFACSPYIHRTSEQECGKPSQALINTGAMLVRAISDDDPEFPFGANDHFEGPNIAASSENHPAEPAAEEPDPEDEDGWEPVR